MTKQEAVIKYISENYLEFNRLRHDVVSDKLQLRMDVRSDRPSGLLEGRPSEGLLDRSLHSLLDNSKNLTMNKVNGLTESEANGLTATRSNSEAFSERERSVWREMTKNDINSIVCYCAQEYNANITSREVITALQSDLIPNVHPLREYILLLPAWKPESGDWIDFVAQQVRVKNNDNEGDTYKNDNTDNFRGNQYLCRDEDTLIQQLKQQITNNIPLANNTASGEGNNTTPPYTILHNTKQLHI